MLLAVPSSERWRGAVTLCLPSNSDWVCYVSTDGLWLWEPYSWPFLLSWVWPQAEQPVPASKRRNGAQQWGHLGPGLPAVPLLGKLNRRTFSSSRQYQIAGWSVGRYKHRAWVKRWRDEATNIIWSDGVARTVCVFSESYLLTYS